METKTPHDGDAESQNAEEPKQNPQGGEEVTKLSQQQEEQFRLHVEDLFDSYNPDTAIEETAVITIARALWMKRTHSEFNSDTRLLDQEISTALGHLYKSKVIRKSMSLPKRTFKNLSARRNNSHHGLIRRPVTTKMRARPDILKLLAPVAAAIDPDPDRTRGNALICKKWSDGRGHGLSPEEASELYAIKGRRIPDEQDAKRRWDLEDKEVRTAEEEKDLAKLRAHWPVELDNDPWTEEQKAAWDPIVAALTRAVAKG
jgi:hypothetical protein